jgi:hypothetical protein
MPAPAQMLSVIRGKTSHHNFLRQLIDGKVETLAKEIYESLEDSNPVINPGRASPILFNALPANIKELIAVQAALDIIHSANYNKVIQQQVGHAVTKAIDDRQAEDGAIEHIKAEGTVIYHGVYHPLESAAITAAFVHSLIGDSEVADVLTRRAETLFIHHDRIQNLDPANRASGYATAKIEGFNEFETAGEFFEERHKLYQAEIDRLTRVGGKQAEIDKLQAMQSELAYEAWKFIVCGTTMLKKVDPQTPIDGQPTLNTVQVLAIDRLLPAEVQDALKSNFLVVISLAASAVDSHFPAALELISEHPEMRSCLPFDLMKEERGIICISPTVRTLMFADHPDAVNKTALFLGQNMRMFSEIHESFFIFKSALTQIQRFSYGDQVIESDGVRVWNEAMHAARIGNIDRLKPLLDYKIGEPPPAGIKVGMTLADVFIEKLQGEIDFANGQGPELIAAAAKQCGLITPPLDVSAWKEHAKALTRLRACYKAEERTPLERSQIALLLFQIAGNQPGLYVKNERLLANIAKEHEALEARITRLKGESEVTTAEIVDLQTKIKSLEAVIAPKADKEQQRSAEDDSQEAIGMSATARMLSILDGDPAQKLQDYKDELGEREMGLAKQESQIKSLSTQVANLERVREDLLHVNKIRVAARPDEPQIQAVATPP